MAARFRVIVLERRSHGAGLGQDWTLALWADVPAARQSFYARAGATSAWKDALAPDNTAIASGAVVERIVTLPQRAGDTLGQMQALAQSMWTDWQTEITNSNPWNRYGTTWDGTTWVLGGVS